MLYDSGPSVKGRGYAIIHREDGTESVIEFENVVTTSGLARIAALLAQDSTSFPSHMSIGDGTVTPTASDTGLGNEIVRTALSGATASGVVLTFRGYFGQGDGNGSTLSEVGLHDSAAGGTFLARALLDSTIAKTASEAVSVIWTWTFS